MHASVFKDTAKSDIRRAGCRLIPLRVQLGAKLTRSAPLGPSEYVHIESCLALEHVVDRPAQFMSQDAQGFPLVMLVLQTAQKLLALGSVPQEESGSFREGPLEVRVADVLARGPHAFATRFLAAFNQARIRGEVLHAWETVDLVNFVEQHEAEDFANARDGVSQVEGIGSVVLGGFEDREFEVLEPFIIMGDKR
jgi:hypothetical protein